MLGAVPEIFMNHKKRRKNSSAVAISLFSFQDIITSLSGVMILLVLLIAVSITTQKLDFNSKQEPAKEVLTDENRKELLKENVAELEKEQKGVKERLFANLSRIKELTYQLAELEKRVASPSMQKRAISFIPAKDDNPNQNTLLIECSGELIRYGIFSSSGSEAANAPTGDSSQAQFSADSKGVNNFFESLESIDRLKYSLLFIIKPSASNYAMQLINKAHNMGFETGYDAIAENQSITNLH
ncbi:MAG: hypothetical protein HQK71_01035 [Desulfamplus sp.]|nr:hypothetical protein [Desulfamplus sp.]